ncbi:hypothetical protein FRACYDRAFT_261862 [Fragilariopsis cylindrus CCMP1102]|uniref:Chalcone isomerase domain-containing protein n=1 Tax=Fragilariopsis cylindrus CCMP1102 TaxID=635003 RepID=A0A1E7FDE4_9STRA|nr:hypothetical protein FRACYDRAFT_261862 [Fragilariopsis cylindrus CCMP1102]|eukprot:OEU15833.1 hypothetical protein FRACYDRAFT_261862 [Fragilariopsis cylindrus CCMP1102]
MLAVEGTSNAVNVNNVAAEECAATGGMSSSSSCSSSSATTTTTTIAATRATATTTTTTIDSSSSLPELSVQQQGQQESTSTSTSTSKIISVEGVDLPGMRILDGVSLYRNGHGMRFIPFFGLSIKIYVASLYSSIPILTVEQIMGKENENEKVDGNGDGNGEYNNNNNNVDNNHHYHHHHHHHGPIQLDFTFLRYVGKSRVVSAWKQQLDHSVTYTDYDEYETEKAKFIQLLSSQPIENLGTQSVQLIDGETRIIDQGKLMGIIRGKKFQRSFLSMWFGPMAVSDELKLNFLRGDAHPTTTSTAATTTILQQQQQQETLQRSTQIPVEA